VEEVVAQASSPNVTDKAAVYEERFDKQLRERLKTLLTDDVIAEHRDNPLGFKGGHSYALQQVVNYFRRAPMAGKYVIVCVEQWKDYRIGVSTGVRGKPPTVLDEPRFSTPDEVLHPVFLLRVRDLMAS
jgi:branched-chain amino acid transport system permease protein